MPKYAAKIDLNQAEIVFALRKIGCTVEPLHSVGRGVPDLLVGRHGCNYLFEIKTGKKKLNPLQVEWHRDWRGQVTVIRTWQEAAAHMGIDVK